MNTSLINGNILRFCIKDNVLQMPVFDLISKFLELSLAGIDYFCAILISKCFKLCFAYLTRSLTKTRNQTPCDKHKYIVVRYLSGSFFLTKTATDQNNQDRLK